MLTTDAADRAALLRAVCADPADDLPRLAFADWCEEHGDEARAEFIRVQCEIWKRRQGPAGPVSEDNPWLAGDSRYQVLHRRERELLGANGSLWVPDCLIEPGQKIACPLPSDEGGVWATRLVLQTGPQYDANERTFVEFRRGFVASVTLTCADWLAHGRELAQAAPLEKVTFSDAGFSVERDGSTVAAFAKVCCELAQCFLSGEPPPPPALCALCHNFPAEADALLCRACRQVAERLRALRFTAGGSPAP